MASTAANRTDKPQFHVSPDPSTIPWVADAIKDLPALVPLTEARAFLHLSERTVQRLISAGHLTRVKLGHAKTSRAMVTRSSLASFLAVSGGAS